MIFVVFPTSILLQTPVSMTPWCNMCIIMVTEWCCSLLAAQVTLAHQDYKLNLRLQDVRAKHAFRLYTATKSKHACGHQKHRE